MAYRIIVLSAAERDLEGLDGQARGRLLRTIQRLAENAHQTIHHRLVNMPEHLAGLCRYRAGDYRVLYWCDHEKKELTIYRLGHRRDIYDEVD